MKPDFRDFLLFGGLGLFGYGLYIGIAPWVSFVACGVIVMLIALSTGPVEK
jgi:hypothetical protein